MLKNKLEYGINILLSLSMLEFGSFFAVLILPVVDFLGCRKAAKKEKIKNSCIFKRSGE